MKLSGNEISTLRNLIGFSQEELGRRVKVTGTHIRYIENGVRGMSEQLHKRIQECFSQFFSPEQLEEIVRMSREINKAKGGNDDE